MADQGGFDDQRLQRISRWMAGHVAAGRLAGLSVQIARQGQVVFSEGHGLRCVEAGLPVTDDTIWRLYSMTKPVATLAALLLYEEGAFQLDQPLSDFLPGFGAAGVWAGGEAGIDQVVPLARPVTVHDLLTHQAGLVYPDPAGDAVARAYSSAGLTLADPGQSLSDYVARLVQVPLAFQPGQGWRYGQANDVLGRLVEVISGRSFGEFLQERIFAPLGMTDTAFGLGPDRMPRLARLYGPGLVPLTPQDDPRRRAPVAMESGGAGLLSTMGDYQRFADLLLNGGRHQGQVIVGRKALAMMTENQVFGAGPRAALDTFMQSPGYGHGFGVSVLEDPARALISGSKGAFGWGGYASTNFWVDPVEGISVILMTQLLPNSTYDLWRQLRVQVYQALV